MEIVTWDSKPHLHLLQSRPCLSLLQENGLFAEAMPSNSVKRKRSLDVTVVAPIDQYAVKAPAPSEPPCKRVKQGQSSRSPELNVVEPVTFPSCQSPQVVTATVDRDNNVKLSGPVLACPPPIVSHDTQVAVMRQTISSQLNLEILLKHTELRLIDQELAKCQVALEQLRRCTEIPYPAMQSASEQVSLGHGAALRKAKERWSARSPAPWGVTDGPYTRHYAKWLLPDPCFDGGRPEPSSSADSTPMSASGRHIRGSVPDFAQLAGKSSRSVRAFNHAALPAGYGEPKQKPTGPMILKRKSDGKMVKLVCPDCGRHDFGSAQGFINHCRIGHQRNFASHDAAAEGCGEPVDVDDSGIIKGAPAEMTPMSSSIHSMVRSAKLIAPDTPGRPILKTGYVSKKGRAGKQKKSKPTTQPPACAQVPYLSALVRNQAANVDLQSLVTEVKSAAETLDADMEDEVAAADSPTMFDANGRLIGAGKMQSMKSTAPGRRIGGGKQLLSQARPKQDTLSGIAIEHDDTYTSNFMSLLPSPTHDSTQAPSLIDDDEELDPQSPASTNHFDDHDVDVQVHDDEHVAPAQELSAHDLHSAETTCGSPMTESMPPPITQRLDSKDNRSTLLATRNTGSREATE